jgi:hypothetical protein
VIVLARNLRACKLDAVFAIAQIQRGVDSSRLLCCSGRVGRGDRIGDRAISGAPMPDEWFATNAITDSAGLVAIGVAAWGSRSGDVA